MADVQLTTALRRIFRIGISQFQYRSEVGDCNTDIYQLNPFQIFNAGTDDPAQHPVGYGAPLINCSSRSNFASMSRPMMKMVATAAMEMMAASAAYSTDEAPLSSRQNFRNVSRTCFPLGQPACFFQACLRISLPRLDLAQANARRTYTKSA